MTEQEALGLIFFCFVLFLPFQQIMTFCLCRAGFHPTAPNKTPDLRIPKFQAVVILFLHSMNE